MIHKILLILFVIFMIFLVVGFNKQMIEKKEKRKQNKKDENGTID
ncbi:MULTISPECIES: hypothetical protein [unclassified Campylobacter]|nr:MULTISPECIES: hypothetical protein [unclassified Campylobacter]MDA3055832.1 hypothetical protein [Campylobacter sp. CN_NA1]MDA3065882.1 hypothetical protein [Campylobacter sp. CN_NE4]MDA3068688.1 hypothetical protein [Campylobacter sp. CN_NE3]MDA3081989.1 hypothetical protein [Campylobacter sp. CN_EL2]MDA3084273.1 hypothetical protein [Campylobacter sp. CN_NE1]